MDVSLPLLCLCFYYFRVTDGSGCANLVYTDGFFDAGMLQLALKAREEESRSSEKAMGNARRAVGKKLRLNDY